jgi:hypothetical protein
MKGTSRFAWRSGLAVLLVGSVMTTFAGGEARAEGVKAAYAISLAGLSVGDATLSLVHIGKTYRAGLAMRLSGLAGLLTGARGAAVSVGSIAGAHPVPLTYAITTSNGRASRTVRMALHDGSVSTVDVRPPVDAFDDRVPVTDVNKLNVMDPISALVMPAPRPDKPLDPAGCDRKLAVFDGVARFDVALTYARTGNVAFPGYSGSAITCSARYTPIAGHRTSLQSTSYMADNRDMEVSLAPIGGSPVLLPVRIAVRTQFGMLQIDATSAEATVDRNSAPKPPRTQTRASK